MPQLCMLSCQFGIKPQGKSIEIAELFEVESALLELGPQADKKIVQTSRELGIAREQDFHVHLGNRQSRLWKNLAESQSHFRVHTRTRESSTIREVHADQRGKPAARLVAAAGHNRYGWLTSHFEHKIDR